MPDSHLLDRQPSPACSSNMGLGFSLQVPVSLAKPPLWSREPDSPCQTALPGTPRPRITHATAATARACWRCGAGRRRRRLCKPTGAARTWSTRKGPSLPDLLVVGFGLVLDKPGFPSVPSCMPGKDGFSFSVA